MLDRKSEIIRINANLLHLSSQLGKIPSAEHRRLALAAHAEALRCGERLLQAEASLQLGALRAPIAWPSYTLGLLVQAERIFRSNGLPQRAAACRVAAARAIYDSGQENCAIAAAASALSDPGLSARDRIYAHVVKALCHGRLGELDEALHSLKDHAIPLMTDSAASPDRGLQARVHWALGLTYLLVVVHHRGRKDRRSTLGAAGIQAVLEPRPTTDSVLACFDQAQALLHKGERWAYIELSRLAMLGGCREPEDAVLGLAALYSEYLDADPPLAALALSSKAELLNYQGRHAEALVTIEQGLDVARHTRMTCIVRDLSMLHSRVLDATGDSAGAMIAFKCYADLQIRSVSITAPDIEGWPRPPSAVPDASSLDRTNSRKPGAVLVTRALRHVTANMGRVMSVSDLATHCSVARRTLEIAFKDVLGTGILIHIKGCKLDHAAGMLQQNSMPVRDLAAHVGYRSAAAFSRDFRRRFGVTPSQWRRYPVSTHAPQDKGCDAG